MANLIQIQNGSKSFASKDLFEDVSFSVNTGEHIGVIGPNGAGKTTLFQIIFGIDTLDEGSLIRSSLLNVGYLSQAETWEPGQTVEEYVSMSAKLPTWELKSLGSGLGLQQELFSSSMDSLSGGFRMRAGLLKLLGQTPNLMLLDEPTNYLDLESVLLLEKFLQNTNSAFLLISHDREFLRRTTHHTLEIEDGEINKFNGNIDDYFEQKVMLQEQLQARALSLQEKKRQILSFVARFGAKATKASQAQSRLKTLEKMEVIEIKPIATRAKISIPAPTRTPRISIKLTDANLGYFEKVILNKVNFLLPGGEHIAVVGYNGAGKSTLLKSLAMDLPLLAGTIDCAGGTTIGYFNQYSAESLEPHDTVFQSLRRHAHLSVLPQEILNIAGALLFSGQDIQKPTRVLSGGEKSRVALGQLLLQKCSCLILDEPTNHLDLQTVEALTQALEKYTGSIVAVSHDRSFIRRIGKKILEVVNGKVNLYPGTYDDYVWSVEKGAYTTLQATQSRSKAAPESSESILRRNPIGNSRESRKQNEKYSQQLSIKIMRIEKSIAQLEVQIQKLQSELQEQNSAQPNSYQKLHQLQSEVQNLESQWLLLTEEKETSGSN